MASALAILTFVGMAPPTVAAPEAQILGAGSGVAVPGRYLVVLKDSASLRASGVAASASVLTGKYRGRVHSVWQRTLSGFAVEMSEDDAKRLAADPTVAYVEQDQVVHLADTQENPPVGLDRIDQRALPLDTTYSYDVDLSPQVHAYVLDTGIRITHNDFGGRASYGRDTVDNDGTANDCEGHGTHVAGTVGGRHAGVAKNVKVVAVRAFNCSGTSTESSIQNGVEWITANAVKPAVANLSIGMDCLSGAGQPAPCPPGTGQTIKTAISNSIATGISYVVAAGNDNIDACGSVLNRIPETIRVGALFGNDSRKTDSNWGSCVDLWAPGTGIMSATNANDTEFVFKDGTSMAAPHVAGAVALMLARPGPAKTPAQVKAQLLAEATPGVVTGLDSASPNKLLYVPPPPVAGGSAVALARHQDGRLALFGTNRTGSMALRSQTQANSDSWSSWIVSSPQTWYSTCAATDSAARWKLVGVKRNQEIWHRSQVVVNADSFGTWQAFDSPVTGCAVAFDGTKLVVFGTTADGRILQRSESSPQGAFTPWGQVLTTPPRMRAIAAERNGNGLVELFGVTGTGQIWHCWQTAAACATATGSGWVQLDGTLLTIAVARNQNNALTVFGANAAGQLFHRVAGPGTNVWSAWQPLDVPGTVGLPRSLAAETNADGRITLVIVNHAGQIWQRKQTGPNATTYGQWTQLDGLLRP